MRSRTSLVLFVILCGFILLTNGDIEPAKAATFDCSSQSSIPQTECEALVAFYNSTDGDNWTNNTGWLVDTDPANWFGITRGSTVSGIRLESNNLVGTLPSELGNLTSIVGINISGNLISGNIPPELGNLTNLENLTLAHNELTGTIPSEIGNLGNLTSLALYNNQLSGSIPPELGSLANLTNLFLSSNNLSGEIPLPLANLSNLQFLDLGSNNLNGSIPTELGALSKLIVLRLYDNELTGEIPSELGNITTLESLKIYSNQLTGALPPELGNLMNLNHLMVSSNLLEGRIPAEYLNLDLQQFYFSSTGICEPQIVEFDTWLADIPTLVSSNLECSEFCENQNSIPQTECEALEMLYESLDGDNWYGKTGWNVENDPCDWYGVVCDNNSLTELILTANNLSGNIPKEIGAFKNLTDLSMDLNNLSGEIPVEIGELSNLWSLNLRYNNLSGSIPSEIGKLDHLNYLSLADNNFSGTLPSEIGGMQAIKWLDISINQISGNIPEEIGYLTNLITLDFRGNPLTGPLPDEIVNLSLSNFRYNSTNICTPQNQDFDDWLATISSLSTSSINCSVLCSTQSSISDLECYALEAFFDSTNGESWIDNTGWLVDSDPCNWYGVFCSDDRVWVLHLQDNNLSGQIPSEIGFLSQINHIVLSDNRITGSIPVELGSTNLFNLYLNNNDLSGEIPVELWDLPNLQELDLQNNLLSGELPDGIEKSSRLEIFNIADNNISGPFPSGLIDIGSLIQIDIAYNNFYGVLPPELGTLLNLEIFRVAHNGFSGGVPKELGNLPSLNYLDVFSNQLTGQLPLELMSIETLDILYFYNTTICEPQNPEMQSWLSGLSDYWASGIDCPYITNLQSPSGKIFATAPTFTWDEDSGAEEYRFYLNNVEGNLVNTWLDEGDVCSSGTCTYSLGSDLELGTYNWALQTRSTIETGPWTDYIQFRVSKPEPLSPTGRINDVRPEYSWDEWEGADDYRLFVSHAAAGTVVNEWYQAEDACSAGTCAATSDVHLRTGNHAFTFQARNDAGTINDWSTYLGFKMLNDSVPSEAIVPVSPTGGEEVTINPTYTWNEVDRASWYKVFIGSNDTSKVYNAYHRAAEVCYGTVCEITPSDYLLSGSPVSSLAYGTTHNWFVMPVNVMGNGEWSSAQNFNTEPEP